MIGSWGRAGVRIRSRRKPEYEGDAFGFFKTEDGTDWIVGKWDHEREPVCLRSEGIEVKTLDVGRWRPHSV